jgi:hypothetical protein
LRAAVHGWLVGIGRKDLPVGAAKDPRPRQLDSQTFPSDILEYQLQLVEVEEVEEVEEAVEVGRKYPLQPNPASAHQNWVLRPPQMVQAVQWVA